MKAQKHACFYVFSPFSAYISPHYIINIKGQSVLYSSVNRLMMQKAKPSINFDMYSSSIVPSYQ